MRRGRAFLAAVTVTAAAVTDICLTKQSCFPLFLSSDSNPVKAFLQGKNLAEVFLPSTNSELDVRRRDKVH